MLRISSYSGAHLHSIYAFCVPDYKALYVYHFIIIATYIVRETDLNKSVDFFPNPYL